MLKIVITLNILNAKVILFNCCQSVILINSFKMFEGSWQQCRKCNEKTLLIIMSEQR